jgi:O-acetyl-ADP-ribose deacetylase (regulator of RNase III)
VAILARCLDPSDQPLVSIMSDLASELRNLRKGRGVMVSDLPERIGPVLRSRAGISAADAVPEARDRLMTYLNGLAAALPEDLGLIFSVVLGLRQVPQSRFVEGRLQWLATELGRDVRTINRRFTEALDLLEYIDIDYTKEDIREEFRDSERLDSKHANGPLNYQAVYLYRLATRPPEDRTRVGFVTGDIRRVKSADVWVNPENTRMRMARFDEHSVSAIIRYEGAIRDERGEVTDDCVAAELAKRVGRTDQVAPGTAIVTRAGQLLGSNNVRYIVHVAAVAGEPGEGYRQVRDIGRCVTNVLRETDGLMDTDPALSTVLIPILGAGMGGGRPGSTVASMLGAVVDHLATPRACSHTVLFLAYTPAELEACTAVFGDSPHLATAQ